MNEGRTPLPVYQCHKQVRAARIVAVDAILAQVTIELPDGTREMRQGRASMFADRIPEPGDYLVIYEDGYRSVSPRAAFEAGYTVAAQAAMPLVLKIEGRFTPADLAAFRDLWNDALRTDRSFARLELGDAGQA